MPVCATPAGDVSRFRAVVRRTRVFSRWPDACSHAAGRGALVREQIIQRNDGASQVGCEGGLESLWPGVFEAHGTDFGEDLDARWRVAHSKSRTYHLEVVLSQVTERCAKSHKRVQYFGGILGRRFDPHV